MTLGRSISNWYAYRHVFVGLVKRDISLRYRGSALGLAWALVNPLLQLATYTLLFSTFMRNGVPNYAVFLLAAFLPWLWFSTSVLAASKSILANAALIKKIYLPTELLPLVVVASNLINYLIALPLLLLLVLLSHIPLTLALLALPGLLVVQFIFTLGAALAVAALNTFYRDIEQMLGLGLMMLMYLTPVVYPASLVPQRYLQVLALNPMFHLIEAYRCIFIEGRWPSALGLGYAACASVALVIVSALYFERKKPFFAEVV